MHIMTDEDLEWARKEGYQAYQDGLCSDDNPYNNNDEWDLYLAWKAGYQAAAWDD
jgi:ribosome modulation factor